MNEKNMDAFLNTAAGVQGGPLGRPTTREIELVEELRGAFRELPDMRQDGGGDYHEAWANNMMCLRERVLNEDPRTFLRWDVILNTMFVMQQDYVVTELEYLMRLPDWSSRWCGAIEECSVGYPLPYTRYPASSGNLIHHAYHLARFEQETGMGISDSRFIFEFGAGYGSMCRLAHNLGFRGRYLLYDLAPFSALQKFFLKSIGFECHSFQSFKTAESGAVCLSDIEELKETLSDCPESAKPLFIATWSLSESPVEFRNSILPLISSFKALLIAYQMQFREIDNVEFFKQWTTKWNNAEWKDCVIDHIPSSRYLFAKAK